MNAVLVSIGHNRAGPDSVQLAAALADAAGGAGRWLVEPFAVAPTPVAVDEPLDHLDGRRLIIDADLTGLQLMLNRLMRRGWLESVETAVLPRQQVDYLNRIGLPRTAAGRLEAAVHGKPQLVGVIKDDSGGVCVDYASVVGWKGTGNWWLRAVVDDQRLCDGPARSVRLRRLGPSELEATVRLGRFGRKTLRGRSLQLACDDALIEQDGVPRERPRTKRIFWSEPKLWNLVGVS